jgi:glycosyltransferase involved in cell wall biosynthesis
MLNNKLTIVVPCKNEENYIHNLLNALKEQKDIDGVKIYIADASTDKTRERIAENKGNLNVTVIQGGPVSVAKNNGARLVETPYILFIDSDVRFFSNTVIKDTMTMMENQNLDLIGLNVRCYDGNIKAQIAFSLFNIVNNILKYWMPFAIGAYMLTRTDRFRELKGFPEKYATSEDFFLSKQYSPKKFRIANHYFGQDSRRFKKMGYFGMCWYLIQNFFNRNNQKHWENIDEKKYWG